MSGGQQMLLGSGDAKPPRFDFSLTAGTNGSVNGFFAGGYGSMSPVNYRNTTVFQILTQAGGDMLISMRGLLPKNYWMNLNMSGPGVTGTILSVNAGSFTNNGVDTQWRFFGTPLGNLVDGQGYAGAFNL